MFRGQDKQCFFGLGLGFLFVWVFFLGGCGFGFCQYHFGLKVLSKGPDIITHHMGCRMVALRNGRSFHKALGSVCSYVPLTTEGLTPLCACILVMLSPRRSPTLKIFVISF